MEKLARHNKLMIDQIRGTLVAVELLESIVCNLVTKNCPYGSPSKSFSKTWLMKSDTLDFPANCTDAKRPILIAFVRISSISLRREDRKISIHLEINKAIRSG